jgi:hypothetical protein
MSKGHKQTSSVERLETADGHLETTDARRRSLGYIDGSSAVCDSTRFGGQVFSTTASVEARAADSELFDMKLVLEADHAVSIAGWRRKTRSVGKVTFLLLEQHYS